MSTTGRKGTQTMCKPLYFNRNPLTDRHTYNKQSLRLRPH